MACFGLETYLVVESETGTGMVKLCGDFGHLRDYYWLKIKTQSDFSKCFCWFFLVSRFIIGVSPPFTTPTDIPTHSPSHDRFINNWNEYKSQPECFTSPHILLYYPHFNPIPYDLWWSGISSGSFSANLFQKQQCHPFSRLGGGGGSLYESTDMSALVHNSVYERKP